MSSDSGNKTATVVQHFDRKIISLTSGNKLTISNWGVEFSASVRVPVVGLLLLLLPLTIDVTMGHSSPLKLKQLPTLEAWQQVEEGPLLETTWRHSETLPPVVIDVASEAFRCRAAMAIVVVVVVAVATEEPEMRLRRESGAT